jgi:hypothetical protein
MVTSDCSENLPGRFDKGEVLLLREGDRLAVVAKGHNILHSKLTNLLPTLATVELQ